MIKCVCEIGVVGGRVGGWGLVFASDLMKALAYELVFQVQRWCTLFVLDVNDNKPRFSETSYFTRVTEVGLL